MNTSVFDDWSDKFEIGWDIFDPRGQLARLPGESGIWQILDGENQQFEFSIKMKHENVELEDELREFLIENGITPRVRHIVTKILAVPPPAEDEEDVEPEALMPEMKPEDVKGEKDIPTKEDIKKDSEDITTKFEKEDPAKEDPIKEDITTKPEKEDLVKEDLKEEVPTKSDQLEKPVVDPPVEEVPMWTSVETIPVFNFSLNKRTHSAIFSLFGERDILIKTCRMMVHQMPTYGSWNMCPPPGMRYRRY